MGIYFTLGFFSSGDLRWGGRVRGGGVDQNYSVGGAKDGMGG